MESLEKRPAEGVSRRQTIYGLIATAASFVLGGRGVRAEAGDVRAEAGTVDSSPQVQPPVVLAPAAPTGPFTVPPLPYAYDALEPHIDEKTMHLHHDKHHAAYVANLNKALADHHEFHRMSVEELLADLRSLPESIQTAVRNNGGGHYNHSLFWQMLKKGGSEPSGALAAAITKDFGSLAAFKEKFTKTALGQFGSGWAWLSTGSDGTLSIDGTPNQDTPLSAGRTPLLGIDVWEHAYYLKYENRRVEYVQAFYNVADWDFAGKRYDSRAKA